MRRARSQITGPPRAIVENTRDARWRTSRRRFSGIPRRAEDRGHHRHQRQDDDRVSLKHICETALLRCGLIGTVRYEIGDRILPAARTTPESLDLQDLLSQMRGAGCRAAVMEVSSHALMQDRVRGIEFDVAVFTNLTQDHLDYHRTMEDYFEAKARLFSGLAGS